MVEEVEVEDNPIDTAESEFVGRKKEEASEEYLEVEKFELI